MTRAHPARIAAVLLAFALPAAAGAAPSLDKPSVIRITDRETSYRRFDELPRGVRAGDIEIARQELYNTRITSKPIGHSELLCTYLTRSRRTCTTTYYLPKGKLVVVGAISTRLLYELPVVGGTGLYANARGSVVVTDRAMHPRREILLFRLQP